MIMFVWPAGNHSLCAHTQAIQEVPLWHSHPQTGILLWVNMKWRLHALRMTGTPGWK